MVRNLTFSADVVVVGSGPGGATVARELSRAGRSVILLERGIDHRGKSYYGTYIGALMYSDRMSLLFTREGLQIVRPRRNWKSRPFRRNSADGPRHASPRPPASWGTDGMPSPSS